MGERRVGSIVMLCLILAMLVEQSTAIGFNSQAMLFRLHAFFVSIQKMSQNVILNFNCFNEC